MKINRGSREKVSWCFSRSRRMETISSESSWLHSGSHRSPCCYFLCEKSVNWEKSGIYGGLEGQVRRKSSAMTFGPLIQLRRRTNAGNDEDPLRDFQEFNLFNYDIFWAQTISFEEIGIWWRRIEKSLDQVGLSMEQTFQKSQISASKSLFFAPKRVFLRYLAV